MGNPTIAGHLERARGTEEVATTIITRVEVLRGRFDFLLKADTPEQLLKAQRLLFLSEERLAELPTLPLDEPALDHFEQHRHTKPGKKIGRADLLIACIALARGATLVTMNRKHFQQIPGLPLGGWSR